MQEVHIYGDYDVVHIIPVTITSSKEFYAFIAKIEKMLAWI
jgi:hypothetical protein